MAPTISKSGRTAQAGNPLFRLILAAAGPVHVLSILVMWAATDALSAGPVLKVAPPSAGTNLVRNPGFEARQGTNVSNWTPAPLGYQVAVGEGRNGTVALFCEATTAEGWRGASQGFTLNQTKPIPVAVSGWSKAVGVSGSADSDYSLYVDLVYQDGTPLWGQVAQFATGTKGWERKQVVVYPEKPIRSLTVYCLFRNHSGKVYFDDVSLEEWTAQPGAFYFQGTPMVMVEPATNAVSAQTHHQTADGLVLGFSGSQLVSVRVGDRELASHNAGGFLARDIASQSDVFGFNSGTCEELGLGLTTSISGHSNHIRIEGRLTNTRGGDRAIMLLFALPLEAEGWSWADDMRRTRRIEGTAEYSNVGSTGCGTTGAMSLYPLGVIHDQDTGLVLALDMGRPAVYRLVYHGGAKQFFIAMDFGLVPESTRFPNAADFRFIIYRTDPRWGFRAGLEKLSRIFPAYFEVRSRQQGIWMPFTDVSTVQEWPDFGFRYHEGDNNVAWDDQHEVLSFRYTEPMTWWMPMSPELPRTTEEALRVREQYASGPAGNRRTMAQVTTRAAMLDGQGNPALLFRNEPWANGAVWSLNPNPHLVGEPNAATVYWNEAARARYTTNAPARLDGEYLDSIEGYVTANLNFDRSHFAQTTVPLSFATDTYRPALFKGLAIHEFTRWISDDVHRLGGLMFANSVPYRFSFLCPWLDVMGTETDWMPGGVYSPVSESQLCLWRSMAMGKPYLLLMNTDYSRFTYELVERYFQRCLAYGIYPSMFSHNAAENPYWQNPSWYNRDRPLFKKYIPLVREVAEAGWQPVPGATLEPAGMALERFGTGAKTPLYFTLLNDSAQSRRAVLRVENDPSWPGGVATELVSGRRLARVENGWEVEVPGLSTAVVKLEPGPRFLRVEPRPGAMELSISTPPGLTHVLEASQNLAAWESLRTNSPATSEYTLSIEAREDRRFLRLRW